MNGIERITRRRRISSRKRKMHKDSYLFLIYKIKTTNMDQLPVMELACCVVFGFATLMQIKLKKIEKVSVKNVKMEIMEEKPCVDAKNIHTNIDLGVPSPLSPPLTDLDWRVYRYLHHFGKVLLVCVLYNVN